MNFNLTRIRRRGFFHSSAFNEVMDSVAWSLSELGHIANITENWIDQQPDHRNIIFGAEQLAPNQPGMLPKSSIIYNLEQPNHPYMPKVRSMAVTCGVTVWDYSLRNIKDWQSIGVDAKHVPIGYTPNLTRIPKAANQDIDVLFLGWMTPRRTAILDELKASGLNVVASNGCYGGGRDNLISRAKVCLNIHQDGMNLFEIVRVSYWMSNSKRVISEISDDDEEYSDFNSVECFRVPYEDIAQTVRLVLETSSKTDNPYALQAMEKRDFTESIKKALSESSPQDKVEARYTKDSPDIGHYMEWLKDHAKGTILEIGVRDGASTSALLRGVEEKGGVVLSVDTEECGHLFAGHPQWKFIRSSSRNPKLRFPDELDIVFIDGDHTREGYTEDLSRFWPHVKAGGMVISHDIDPVDGQTLEDVPSSDYPSRAIREEYFKFCDAHGLRHEEIPGKYGLGIMYKPEVVESEESWQASEALLK